MNASETIFKVRRGAASKPRDVASPPSAGSAGLVTTSGDGGNAGEARAGNGEAKPTAPGEDFSATEVKIAGNVASGVAQQSSDVQCPLVGYGWNPHTQEYERNKCEDQSRFERAQVRGYHAGMTRMERVSAGVFLDGDAEWFADYQRQVNEAKPGAA